MLAFLDLGSNTIWEEDGKVLLVENDLEAKKALSKIMEKHGVKITQNQNGAFILNATDMNKMPNLQLIEWIDELFQGYEVITFQEWNK